MTNSLNKHASKHSQAVVPWMASEEVDTIEAMLRPHWHVLEYGSGGSTVWFARRVKRVTSIEHDRGWVRRAASLPANVDLRLVPPQWKLQRRFGPAEPGQFASYVAAADDIAPQFVLIDGRARVACAQRWAGKAIVVLHDSNRPRYRSLSLQTLRGSLALVRA
ncbi:hypothetical protein FYK55_28525 [Roseiconus nitratireducens]|uniref:Class I SAM-dependent methyltransferase n=1 Tax=Roseiconus nitratireducens TaxID=2605748 RepID=A0A5M6CQK6_9BACT|nr:hypothetical protein [Roseiconus nitratireducens]KAA5535419.1 hypothetical protein FYK55_28525 [Roseiconus nitratireducens]